MRIGIIGLGTIGKVHKEVIDSLSEDLVAICDNNPNVLSKYSKIKGYLDYQQMIDKENLDVVHICTPHYLHTEMILYALNKNLNVLCEKPLCIKMEDIPLILEAEKNSLGKLGVCHQNRYNNVNMYLNKYLEDKSIISAHGEVIWCRRESYYAQAEWRGKVTTEGGGVLINQALHTLDLMQWFCGEPQSVDGVISRLLLSEKIEVEDTAMLYCNGKTPFSFFATNTGGSDLPTEVKLYLSNGEYIVAYPDRLFINNKLVTQENMSVVLGKCCYGNGHEKLILDFYDCIKNNKPFAIDGNEACKAIKIILQIYRKFFKKGEQL